MPIQNNNRVLKAREIIAKSIEIVLTPLFPDLAVIERHGRLEDNEIDRLANLKPIIQVSIPSWRGHGSYSDVLSNSRPSLIDIDIATVCISSSTLEEEFSINLAECVTFFFLDNKWPARETDPRLAGFPILPAIPNNLNVEVSYSYEEESGGSIFIVREIKYSVVIDLNVGVDELVAVPSYPEYEHII